MAAAGNSVPRLTSTTALGQSPSPRWCALVPSAIGTLSLALPFPALSAPRSRASPEQEFVEGRPLARPTSHSRILFRHILPNTLGPIIVYTTLTIPGVMLPEATLSFLGLGVETAAYSSWGILIDESQPHALQSLAAVLPHPLLPLLSLFALNFLGDGLRPTRSIRSPRRIKHGLRREAIAPRRLGCFMVLVAWCSGSSKRRGYQLPQHSMAVTPPAALFPLRRPTSLPARMKAHWAPIIFASASGLEPGWLIFGGGMRTDEKTAGNKPAAPVVTKREVRPATTPHASKLQLRQGTLHPQRQGQGGFQNSLAPARTAAAIEAMLAQAGPNCLSRDYCSIIDEILKTW